jgi:hypothetical protein
MIQFYKVKLFRVTPDVGQSIVFWLVCQAGEKDSTLDAFGTSPRSEIEEADSVQDQSCPEISICRTQPLKQL